MGPTLLRATRDNLAKARADHGFYTGNCLKIRTKQAQLVPLVLNESQRHIQALASKQLRETGRIRVVVLKARQPGVSTYVASRTFRRIHLYPHQNAGVIANDKTTGAELFAIYELFDRELPDDWRPQKSARRAGQQLHYNTRDGRGGLNSKVRVETANDTSAFRGSTIQVLHASELAFWANPDETYVALAQAVPDVGSEIWVESTANGVGNLFHQIWEGAVAGTNGYIPIFLPWWFHDEYQIKNLSEAEREEILETLTPVEKKLMEGVQLEGVLGFEDGLHPISVEQLAWRRRTIRDKLQGDERKFRQEYPATPREAFLTSGNLFFEEDVLLDYEDHATPAPHRGRLVLYKGAILFRDQLRDHLRVWEKPQPNCHYVIAADTATGKGDPREADMEALTEAERERGGHDFSCADVVKVAEVVTDPVTREQKLLPRLEHVAQLHGRIVPEQFAKDIRALGFFYSNPKQDWKTTREPALIGVERNHSSGETVVRLLKDTYHYPRLYYNRTFNQRMNKMTTAAGFVTTVANRQVILDQLAMVLREGLFKYPNPDGIREMFTFVRDPVTGKPEAQEGTHDDRVLTGALSIEMAKTYVPLRPRRPPPPEHIGSSPTGLFDYDDAEGAS